jgi:predicted transcriptional regulator
MGEPDTDFFVNTEPEVEVDAETAAAIELGIKAADEGRGVTLTEARKRMRQSLPRPSSQNHAN